MISSKTEKIGKNPENGRLEFVKNDSDYVKLQAQGQKKVFYALQKNRYESKLDAEGDSALISDEEIAELPIHWDYDKIKKDEKTGESVNLYPPTTKNIESKRQELIKAAIEAGERPDFDAIYVKTSPRRIEPSKRFQRLLNEVPADIKLAQRLAGKG